MINVTTFFEYLRICLTLFLKIHWPRYIQILSHDQIKIDRPPKTKVGAKHFETRA